MSSSGPRIAPSLVAELFRGADAGRWSLTEQEFADALQASASRAFADSPLEPADVERYLKGLHLEDLAVATACARGRDAAWDHFVREHRPVLYRAADALDASGAARELADSLYADLYGMQVRDGERRSLFYYFHGRSGLATWLRAVLAQRYVDALRAGKRLDPLPDDTDVIPAAAAAEDPDRRALLPLVANALIAAIDALLPKDRLRLKSYYVSQLTLAEIGRITGEHEATVSRHLARTRRTLKEGVERHLRDRAQLSRAQAERALELAIEDPGSMDVQQLFDLAAGRKEPAADRSNRER
jgi:RNA polymerase sigma-70 factor (ECF subfamily)